MKKLYFLIVAILLACSGSSSVNIQASDASVATPTIHKLRPVSFTNTNDFPVQEFSYDSCDGIVISSAPNGFHSTNNKICDHAQIPYNGGPVMTNPLNIYFIWYGNWTDNNAKSLLSTLVSDVSNSSYWQIIMDYCQESDFQCGNTLLNYSGSINVDNTFAFNDNLSTNDISGIVNNVLANKLLPTDINAIYVLFMSQEIEVDSSCLDFCAYHSARVINGKDIKFAFVQDTQKCPSNCTSVAGDRSTPNDDFLSDTMATLVLHELSETITDPIFTGWTIQGGNEMADRCVWDYGDDVYLTSNGARANIKLGQHDYLVQQLWLNQGMGQCVMQRPNSAINISNETTAKGGCNK